MRIRSAIVAPALVVMLGAPSPPAQPPQRGELPPLLPIAVDTATWLRSAAIETEHGLVWPSDPRDPKTVALNLYSGSPGVVLFLLELHHATKEEAYLAEAKRGADHLLASTSDVPQAGLYSGVAGIGYTLGEVYRATRDDKYLRGVRQVVERLSETAKPTGGGVEWSNVSDIIGGTAGTGLFLIQAAERWQIPGALDLARKAGTRLLEIGVPEHGGTKWRMSPDFPRLMPNFSHGTAGIAYFLADLYRATNDRAYLDGALAGARYLQAVAETEGDICLVFHHEPEEEGLNLFYLGWCHGPAGTARLWYQLARVTGDRAWIEWTEKSARGIVTSGIPETRTPGFWNNVSQCCGSAGVASFLAEMHGITKKPEYLAFARRVTADMVARATRDGNGTRWVQAEHRVRPELLVAQTGWMQGASGMGAWLVQMDGLERGRRPFLRFPDSPFGASDAR